MHIDEREALRYLGVKNPDAKALRRVAQTARRMEKEISPRWVWRCCRLVQDEDGYHIPECELTLSGHTVRHFLQNSGQIALMACTLGVQFDSELRRLEQQDMVEAAYWNACGNALVETACDAVEAEIAERLPSWHLGTRFSPGYGDLPLSLQPVLLNALNAGRRLGLTLTEAMLMLPVKSVTALLGLHENTPLSMGGCGSCGMSAQCAYRRDN